MFALEQIIKAQKRNRGLIDCTWVRDHTVPMHLGLNNRPFVPHVKSWEPSEFTKVPDGPKVYTLNILRLQEKRTQME
jgi:hypothetical protein